MHSCERKRTVAKENCWNSRQRPFELPQNTKSLDQYNAVWERFICYMMRTAPKEQGHWEDETGE
jgi:hypothetical protein